MVPNRGPRIEPFWTKPLEIFDVERHEYGERPKWHWQTRRIGHAYHERKHLGEIAPRNGQPCATDPSGPCCQSPHHATTANRRTASAPKPRSPRKCPHFPPHRTGKTYGSTRTKSRTQSTQKLARIHRAARKTRTPRPQFQCPHKFAEFPRWIAKPQHPRL